MLSLLSRSAIARTALVTACAATLSTAAVQAATPATGAGPVAAPAAASNLLAEVSTIHGETVRFTLLPDGSVGVADSLPAAAAPFSVLAQHREFRSPLELFRAVAPGREPSAALTSASNRYVSALENAPALQIAPAIKTAQAPRKERTGLRPDGYSEQWFINDYCNPASGSSFNVCYTDAWSWAYLSDSSVYYGHAVTYAKTHSLTFTVLPVGQWFVPQGYIASAYEYHFSPFGWNNFSFYAAVNNAQQFDFESDIDY